MEHFMASKGHNAWGRWKVSAAESECLISEGRPDARVSFDSVGKTPEQAMEGSSNSLIVKVLFGILVQVAFRTRSIRVRNARTVDGCP